MHGVAQAQHHVPIADRQKGTFQQRFACCRVDLSLPPIQNGVRSSLTMMLNSQPMLLLQQTEQTPTCRVDCNKQQPTTLASAKHLLGALSDMFFPPLNLHAAAAAPPPPSHHTSPTILLRGVVSLCVQLYLKMVVQQQGLQPGICKRGEQPPQTVGAAAAAAAFATAAAEPVAAALGRRVAGTQTPGLLRSRAGRHATLTPRASHTQRGACCSGQKQQQSNGVLHYMSALIKCL